MSSTPKVVQWKHVAAMLDACAKGWSYEDKKHRRWVYFGVHSCKLIPLGEHGKRARQNYEVPTGKVRNLIWTLGVGAACATTALGFDIPERP